MKRVLNFNAGPAILPVSVLEEASRGVLEIHSSGMSILEVSHRGKDYEAVHFDARDRLLRMMGLPKTEYTALFLGGGASMQFAMLPMNYSTPDQEIGYVHTGEWSSKAFKEAKRFGKVQILGSSEDKKFSYIPQASKPAANLQYMHITTNNTIEGTEFFDLPDAGSVPLIGDCSSDFLAVDRDYKKFSMIYAGAQKNIGPAGVTAVVFKNSYLEKASENVPTILSYKAHAKADSLYNTPPAFSIYVVGLVLKWIEEQGGIAAQERLNRKKASYVYDALDEFPEIYESAVSQKKDRSLVNITFRLKNVDKEKSFLSGAEERGMDGLKGHRSVGGFRASMYNAFPLAGAEKLADYLREFARKA